MVICQDYLENEMPSPQIKDAPEEPSEPRKVMNHVQGLCRQCSRGHSGQFGLPPQRWTHLWTMSVAELRANWDTSQDVYGWVRKGRGRGKERRIRLLLPIRSLLSKAQDPKLPVKKWSVPSKGTESPPWQWAVSNKKCNAENPSLKAYDTTSSDPAGSWAPAGSS